MELFGKSETIKEFSENLEKLINIFDEFIKNENLELLKPSVTYLNDEIFNSIPYFSVITSNDNILYSKGYYKRKILEVIEKGLEIRLECNKELKSIKESKDKKTFISRDKFKNYWRFINRKIDHETKKLFQIAEKVQNIHIEGDALVSNILSSEAIRFLQLRNKFFEELEEYGFSLNCAVVKQDPEIIQKIKLGPYNIYSQEEFKKYWPYVRLSSRSDYHIASYIKISLKKYEEIYSISVRFLQDYKRFDDIRKKFNSEFLPPIEISL